MYNCSFTLIQNQIYLEIVLYLGKFMHLESFATHNYYICTLTQLTYVTHKHIQGGLPWLGQWALTEPTR
jgi:hypothetical protein